MPALVVFSFLFFFFFAKTHDWWKILNLDIYLYRIKRYFKNLIYILKKLYAPQFLLDQNYKEKLGSKSNLFFNSNLGDNTTSCHFRQFRKTMYFLNFENNSILFFCLTYFFLDPQKKIKKTHKLVIINEIKLYFKFKFRILMILDFNYFFVW